MSAEEFLQNIRTPYLILIGSIFIVGMVLSAIFPPPKK